MTKTLTREQKSKRMVLVWLFSFFGVIFIMNAYMITKAATTFNGVVAKKSYQQGINYNQTLANKKQIVEEGLTYKLILAKKPDSVLDVKLELSHADNSYKMPENVVLTFWRPATEGQDFMVNLIAKKDYTNQVQFRENQKGAWNIKYQLKTLDGKIVDFKDRVYIR
jgi:nitrogen fixation protein FixH